MEVYDIYEDVVYDINVIYTSENIPTKGTKSQFQEIATGCQCMQICTIESNCQCLHKSFNYTSDLSKIDETVESIQDNYKLYKRGKPLYECNQNCLCTKYCGNKLVQLGPRKHLKLSKDNMWISAETEKKVNENSKGTGLFTEAAIKAGNFVCEYAGEVISMQEASSRFKLQEKNNVMNYIFCVNETFGTNAIRTYVDPSKFGNIGRYINHSCNPNCEVIPVRVNYTVPKLCVFAVRDIEVEEEITFDYGDGQLGFSPDDPSIQKRKKCLCDYINCRKYLPFSKQV